MKGNDFENLKGLIAERIFRQAKLANSLKQTFVDSCIDYGLINVVTFDKPFIIAMDGMSASLKTTVAERLAVDFDGAVIHCDDFFLPMELRTQERLEEPGGNIHYERMKTEVIDKFPDRLEAYTRFDCSVMAYKGIVEVPRKRLYIVEGAYALHPYFGKYYDVSIFMRVSKEEQIKRLKLRNGNTDTFVNKWIPMEKIYNKSYEIENNADIVVDTTDWRSV